MLEESFSKVYNLCKLHFYRRTCTRFVEVRKNFALTTSEAFSMEGILALGKPTIAQFSRLMGLSTPNAASRIKGLVQKGCLRKVQSKRDKREFYLEATPEYRRLYYGLSDEFLHELTEAVQGRFTPEEVAKMDEMIAAICDELAPNLKMEEEN